MSSEIKETKQGFLDQEMTRRHFLKISGKSLVGLSLTPSMLLLMGATQTQVDSGAVMALAQRDGLMIVNKDLCTGCVRCEVVCTTVNDGASSTHNARLKVTRNLMANDKGVGMYHDLNGGWVYYPDTCRQCRPTPCLEACPFNAIVDQDGRVQIIADDCLSCGVCVSACPWSMITMNTSTGKATMCNYCGECVRFCPTGALRVVPWDEVTAAAQMHWPN